MIPLSLRARSTIPGLSFPALVPRTAQVLHSLLLQLEQTQWLSPTELKALQNYQLGMLLSHVWANVPWYHQRLKDAGLVPGTIDISTWANLKLLTRRDIQDAGTTLHATSFPKEHGHALPAQTSGSTGEPVQVLQTELDQLFWHAITLRDHAWHGRDVTGTLCGVRANVEPTPEGAWNNGWGASYQCISGRWSLGNLSR